MVLLANRGVWLLNGAVWLSLSLSPCHYKLIMQLFPINCDYACSLHGLLQFAATVCGMLRLGWAIGAACAFQTSASLAMERTTGARWTTLWVEGSVSGGTSSTLISTSTSRRSMHPFWWLSPGSLQWNWGPWTCHNSNNNNSKKKKKKNTHIKLATAFWYGLKHFIFFLSQVPW